MAGDVYNFKRHCGESCFGLEEKGNLTANQRGLGPQFLQETPTLMDLGSRGARVRTRKLPYDKRGREEAKSINAVHLISTPQYGQFLPQSLSMAHHAGGHDTRKLQWEKEGFVCLTKELRCFLHASIQFWCFFWDPVILRREKKHRISFN